MAAETDVDCALIVDAAPVSAADVFAWSRADLADGEGAVLRLFRPDPAVVVGRDQAIAREVRLDWCRARAIPVLRRPTGGGALWLDPGQWALCLLAPAVALGADPAARLATGGAILVEALARLGVAARFVPPNDVEVAGGAKIGSVFLAEAGERALLFATLLVAFDVAAALSALLVPTEKLTVTGLEHARERVATLADRLDPLPDATTVAAALAGAAATRLGATMVPKPAPAAPVSAATPVPDPWEAPLRHGFETLERTARATLRLRLERADDGSVAVARFATDAAVVPADLADRIAAALSGRALADLPAAMAGVLGPADLCLGFSAADLVRLAARAAEKDRLASAIGLEDRAVTGVMLAGPGGSSLTALERASVVLVPYCAKPAWCALRPTPDCIDCGHCAVGDAYRLARERGLEVTTILNFEHLSETLAEMRARGVDAYLGMCCSDFFLKRHVAFREAGMDGVLMDIVGATCYELKEEHLAYAGTFRAEAALDLDTLEKMMAAVPARPGAGRD
jgi:lipoate-protein ligase A